MYFTGRRGRIDNGLQPIRTQNTVHCKTNKACETEPKKTRKCETAKDEPWYGEGSQ